MAALAYLQPWLICGWLIARWLLPRHSPVNRLWIGGTLGVVLLMWLPALWAFPLRFGIAAHLAALAALGLLTLAAFLLRDRRAPKGWDAKERVFLWQVLGVAVPLTLLFAFLQYTHVFRVDADGNWNVGQSTYGDLPMHTAFITGMKNAAFPPEYTMFPGHRLTYPFLTDSLSSTFYLLGMRLQAAVIVPSVLMFSLTCLGVMALCRELSAGRKAVVFAALFFFLNGGLGFLYDFDQAGGFEADSWIPRFWERIEDILTGYYKTPTNQPEPNNLRWSNVIADMFVPQRTFLGGVCAVLPCFYLLWCAFAAKLPGAGKALVPADETAEKGGLRAELLLGVWAGAMPLIHTHSFLALGLCSAGFMLHDLITRADRWRLALRYLRYAAVALTLALPQLLGFTFYQALGRQPDTLPGFLTFQFNWVNNPGGRGLRDFVLWFYLKNIGLPFALLLLGLFSRSPKHRRILCGAAAIWLTAELVRFQPNEYDNNKLFYLAWLLCCPVAADTAGDLWRRLKGFRARPLIAAAGLTVTFLSAGLTLWREAVSDYQAFPRRKVEAAEFILANTEEDSVFLTGAEHHLNPVDSIAGRAIVCGPDLWLYYHGFNTYAAKADVRRFLEDPAGNLDVVGRYGVDYVLVSDYERSDYNVNESALDALYPLIYDQGGTCIWQVPEG